MNRAQWVGVGASLLSLVPIAWVVTKWRYGKTVDPVAAWVSAALLVGFVADLLAFAGHASLASNLYPVVLGSMLGAVLLPGRAAFWFSALLTAVAFVSLAWRQGHELDVLTRTVAFGGIVVAVWRAPLAPSRLRLALTVLFGVGTVAWYGYVLDPGWPSWLVLQGVRWAGTVLVCRSA